MRQKGSMCERGGKRQRQTDPERETQREKL